MNLRTQRKWCASLFRNRISRVCSLDQDLILKRLELTLGRLNLTPATHVHLIEPQWNPMVELQAAARVDRLDQENDVVILRYIVEDSIEKVGLLVISVPAVRLIVGKYS